MSNLEIAMIKQQIKDLESRIHNFCSAAGNALERIDILLDEQEWDDAKEEIADLREALAKIRVDQ